MGVRGESCPEAVVTCAGLLAAVRAAQAVGLSSQAH